MKVLIVITKNFGNNSEIHSNVVEFSNVDEANKAIQNLESKNVNDFYSTSYECTKLGK